MPEPQQSARSRRFTNSEVAAFKRCRRKWWLAYYRKLGLLRDEDAVSVAKVGTLTHLGLDTYYSGGTPDVAVESVRVRVAQDIAALIARDPTAAGGTRVQKVEKQGALVVTMLEGYFEWLEETGADMGLETIASEEKVEVPIAGLPGVSLLGKLDTRVRRELDGAVLFVDHKTITGSTDDYAEGLYRSPQFKHYHLLEYLRHLADVEAGLADPESEHRGTDGVIVNMLRRVGRGKTAKPPFYGRHEVRHNVHVLRTYWAQVMGEITRILDVEQQLDAGRDPQEIVPPNATRDCSWDCFARPICPMFDDGSDVESVISMAYVVGDPLARYDDEPDDTDERP